MTSNITSKTKEYDLHIQIFHMRFYSGRTVKLLVDKAFQTVIIDSIYTTPLANQRFSRI